MACSDLKPLHNWIRDAMDSGIHAMQKICCVTPDLAAPHSITSLVWPTATVAILRGGWGGNESLSSWIKSWSSG